MCMHVELLDHVNIITADLDATASFYESMLGLERRNGPGGMSAQLVQWMYDPAGRPVLHLNSVDCPRAYDREVAAGPTGSIHHVALRCVGFAEMVERLQQAQRPFQVVDLASISLKQIFTEDPNGVLLELNFYRE
jgi:catechol 2,3-dioxygenase-like lactoylglutathione lyase family enzyme